MISLVVCNHQIVYATMSPTFLTDKESVQIQVVFSSIQSYSAQSKSSNGNAVALWVDMQLTTVFIIWQAPRAGNMTKSRALIGYRRGLAGAILLARDCPFCFCNNISPKSKRVHETFLSQNSCLDVKDFLWFFCRDGTSKQKPKRTITFKNNWLRFQCSKIKYEDHFFSVRSIKSFIDQASSVKMAGYWPSSLFVLLWTSTSSWPIKMQKRELGQYPCSHLDLASGQ